MIENDTIILVAIVIMFFIFIAFHEIGHYIAALHYRMNPRFGFSLRMMAFTVNFKKSNITNSQDVLDEVNHVITITAAGALGTLPLAISFFIFPIFPQIVWLELIIVSLSYTVWETATATQRLRIIEVP